MEKQAKADILGCRVDILGSEEAISRTREMIYRSKPGHIITLNAEIVYQAQSSQELRETINGADLVTPDGIGIVWGGKKLGYDFRERVTGIDLLYRLCQAAPAEGWKIYLLGSAPGVAEEAAHRLIEANPGLQIAGTRDGYFSEEDIPELIKKIKELSPHILFVAMGAPKQEYWIKKYKDILGVPACIGVGGSLDVIAGHKKRAPGWMIKLNLEWLYRLLSEPSRFQRQLVLPKFMSLILKSRFKGGI